MMEKYDGVGVFWNGSQLITKTGKVIDIPSSLLSTFPVVPFEAELWYRSFFYVTMIGVDIIIWRSVGTLYIIRLQTIGNL